MAITILLIILGIVVYYHVMKTKNFKEEISKSNSNCEVLTHHLNELRVQVAEDNNSIASLTNIKKVLEKKVSSLEKYEGILDIENHINKLKEDTDLDIKNERNKWLNELDSQSRTLDDYKETIIREGNQLKSQVQSTINKTLDFFEEYKQKFFKEVELENKKLFGMSYAVFEKSQNLESVVKALENKIKGYGDEFIIPAQTMLDELIDGYSHLDASHHLKKIKEQTKLAVKNGIAADCDYVEDNRKRTAIEFITNAFNGRADVYISRLRHDNVGKLLQALNDDFILLNKYGQAFRNARITQSYLDLRIEELKWGAMILEFREQEREEQRELREQIREEERARREYEKAIKDAEKEEKLLKKAYEKALQEFEKASDDQKAKYDQKMQDLIKQLKEAEEKNQRALSMAQQTRAGHVYVISNIGSFGEDVLKLGMTRRLEPLDRVRELGDASVPFTFDVHAMIYSEDAPQLEKQLHRHFNHQRVNKVNYRKEFFQVALTDVREYLVKLGVNAQFTLKAEALQYRESLRIEAMPEDEQRNLEERLEKLNETMPVLAEVLEDD